MTKILRALALASACACSVNAQVIFPGGSGATIGSYTVATLPATSTVGTLAIVTDASTAGSCTAGGGTALSLCRWSGAAWTTVGGSGGSGTVINTYLVSTLPASPTTNTLAVVTDSSPTGSCTAGGGSGHALCQYTGSAWVTVAPVSVGSGTAGQVAGYSATGNVIAGETIVNDTNVTAAISGGNFTIGWSGTLAKARLLTTVVYADQSNTWSAGTQNFSSAAHTLPAVTVAASGSLPAMCTAGEIAFVTGATAGQNIYECGSTNTWTQQLNSGGGGSPISGATTNALVTAASSTTIQTPSAAATMDSSGNISTAGGIITGVGSSVAGHEAYGAGTAFTAPTSSVGFQAPSSVTTKFMMTLPGRSDNRVHAQYRNHRSQRHQFCSPKRNRECVFNHELRNDHPKFGDAFGHRPHKRDWRAHLESEHHGLRDKPSGRCDRMDSLSVGVKWDIDACGQYGGHGPSSCISRNGHFWPGPNV